MEGLNSHLKDRYKRLERRVVYIREQILNHRGSEYSITRYKAELSSLEWAMRITLKYYKEHPNEDDHIKPCEECIQGVNPANGETCNMCEGSGEIKILSRKEK